MQGKREMLDVLKPLVTNVKIEIRGMAQDKRMIENRANWAFCTNYKDAVLKSKNDRRYCVMFTAQQSASDIVRGGMGGQFFPNLYDWLREGGGYEAVAGYLSRYDIPAELDPTGACHRAPVTTSTQEAVAASIGGIEGEVIEASEDNTVGFRGGWVSSWALDKLLRDRGIRIGRNKQSAIIEEMGFFRIGRAHNFIMQEDGKRPVLWSRDADADPADYCAAQNYANLQT